MPNSNLSATWLFLAVTIVGCETNTPSSGSQASAPAPLSPEEREKVLDAIAQIQREADNTEPPPANITLATPDGWAATEQRPLPPSDNGFTVGYEHESGLTVTLYQFTRGLSTIPSEPDSQAVQEEMERAKSGIQQAVQLGYWQAAKEAESDIVALGDSSQKALWSRYQLTVEGMTLLSDIYVWSRADTFFKIRCTCRSADINSNQAALRPLLTAFGSPITGGTE